MKTFFKPDYSYPVPRICGKNIKFPIWVEQKLDGELAYIRANKNLTEVLNKPKYGRHRIDLPLTEELQKKVVDKGINEIVLAGELVSGEGKFMTFKKLDLNAGFRSFAVVSLNGIDLTSQLRTENQKVFDVLDLEGKYLKKAEGRLVRDSVELKSYFEEVAQQNFEGLVAKDLRSKALPDGETGYWIKLKRFYSADLAVLGFTKEAKHLSLVLGLPNGKRITNCGNGFTFKEKELFHKELAQEVIREDRENYYVEPKIVVEIKHQGIIYNSDGTLSSVRMPIFLRVRQDKDISECGFDPSCTMEVA